ncbi:MAG: nucleotidyltransferase domain-containing protein [Armatimonadia bacterium]
MITETRPLPMLLGKTRSAILGLLFGHVEAEYHLREIVRVAQVGLGPAQRELAQLVAAGLVTRRKLANLVLYRANPQSPVFAEIRALVMKGMGVAGELAEALGPLRERIEVAFIYGSVAEGRETAGSDVDLVVIGDVRLEEVVEALYEVQEQVGREISPVVYSRDEVEERLRRKDHFVTAVWRGTKVSVIGNLDKLTL